MTDSDDCRRKDGPPHVPPFFCSGPMCPGLPYRASDTAHPVSCALERPAVPPVARAKDPWIPAHTVDEAQALLVRALDDPEFRFDGVALEEAVTHWVELYRVPNCTTLVSDLAAWRSSTEPDLSRHLIRMMLLAMNAARHLVPAND